MPVAGCCCAEVKQGFQARFSADIGCDAPNTPQTILFGTVIAFGWCFGGAGGFGEAYLPRGEGWADAWE